MKSNDTLLCHIVATDEMLKEASPKCKTDTIVYNPTKIYVPANEVVYIHFFHCATPDFTVVISTPTDQQEFTPTNTIDGSSNTIIKGIGHVDFKASEQSNFFVQYLRIHY